MATRRRALTFGSAVLLLFSAAVFAQQTPAPQKLSNAEKKEITTVIKIVDDAMAGQPSLNDLALAWQGNDILKAQGNKEYVPFTISFDPTKVSGDTVSLYWRVVRKDPPAVAAVDPKDAKKGDKKDVKKVDYAYEDLDTVNFRAPVTMGATATTTSNPGAETTPRTIPGRISRSFTAAAGVYDVYVVVKEPTPEKSKKGDPAQKTSVITQTVTVPDLWNGEFTTSSVLVAERIDPLPVQLTPLQQGERPYALGAMEIVPATSTKFTKKNEISTFLLIYNVKTDATNKPDVSVEYNFYAKQAAGEKFFNKTNPQNLNAQTLPPQFDFAAGHQLQSGQAVPLASFPEGEYRLEITIVDKLDGNKTLKREVNFSVGS